MSFIASKETGRISIFGAPFDSTSSFRTGSRFAPQAIRDASHGLERYSPEQDYDLEDVSFSDDGDLELPFGDPEPAIELIRAEASSLLNENRLPFLLGGEHLVSLGAFTAVHEKYPDIKVLLLDAHADLRDDYLGSRLSHATVARRLLDIVGLDGVSQIGIRSMDKTEADLARKVRISMKDSVSWASGKPVYLSCDLDILDPSVLPGTGTPEPGGLSFKELKDMLEFLIKSHDIAAMDIVELAPSIDHSGNSSVVAAKLVRECLISLGKKYREVDHAGGQRTSKNSLMPQMQRGFDT